MKTLYELLGLERSATTAQIKKAYRDKAKTSHPDVGGDPDEFAALASAHDVLTDQESRERYDTTGEFGRRHDTEEQALELLLNLLAQAVEQQMQVPTLRIMDSVATSLNGIVANTTKEQKRMVQRTAVMEKIIAGLRPINSGGENKISPRLSNMLQALKANLAKFEQQQSAQKRAQEIIAGFVLDGDSHGRAAPQFIVLGQSFFVGTSI